MKNLFRLNTKKIQEIITQQQLKKWWIAEFSGIHKTTLRRWLNGKISTVRKKNLSKLAQILSIEEHEISFPIPFSKSQKYNQIN